jgi:hypothetical protein
LCAVIRACHTNCAARHKSRIARELINTLLLSGAEGFSGFAWRTRTVNRISIAALSTFSCMSRNARWSTQKAFGTILIVPVIAAAAAFDRF